MLLVSVAVTFYDLQIHTIQVLSMRTYALTPLECTSVQAILSAVLNEQSPVDRAIALEFKTERMPETAQLHIIDAVGDMLRRLNLLAFLADVPLAQAGIAVQSLICQWHLLHNRQLPNLRVADQCDQKVFETRRELARQQPALWDGCPEWLEDLGQQQLGLQWPAERAALTQAAKRYIRVNTLKCNETQLQHRLQQEHIDTRAVEGVPGALEVTSNGSLFRTQAFKDGWFEQQDAGSQLIAPFLGVEPGMRVIDACAGAGGKTLHLAALMAGKGRLLAMDVEQWKLDNLRLRARRAGAHNIEPRLIESSKTIKRLKESADRLLLDVPCSGLGVVKRNPDTKWRDTAERLPVLLELQADILRRYSKMVKVGGQLVYATCSLLPAENQDQVAKFLNECDGQFTLLKEHTVSPAQTGFDGFYMALLQRN